MKRSVLFRALVLAQAVLVVAGLSAQAAAGKYKEAPMLEALVKAGKLPAVQNRLPEKPFVTGQGVLVRSEDLKVEVGKYGGGVLRSITSNPELDWNLRDAAMENFLTSPAHTTGPIQGNVAESYTVNADNTVFTFTLRKGLKWSDGVPVTTEDVRFAWEDVLLNKAITPALSAAYRAGGKPGAEPMKLEIVDQYTFKITFTVSYGRFFRQMGVGQLWGGYNDLLKPSHYLKPFHIKYTSIDKLRPLMKEMNLVSDDDWFRLFMRKDILWHQNMASHAPGFPVLGPWMRVKSAQDLMVMERNPYYYKVDTAGNQLPYIDRYESVIVNDPESIPLKIIAGEVNFNRDLIAHDKVSLLKENEKKGKYTVDLSLEYHNAPVALYFNYNNPDPTWQSVVLDRKFREAVNFALNRKALIDVVFLGIGTTSPWFPGEFNKAKANALLDEMGMNKRDSEGYRLAPNGKRFEIFMEYYEAAADWERMVQLLRADLEAVGLRTPMKKIQSQLWTTRRDANELFASIDWLDDVNWPYLTFDYMPDQRMRWGMLWHQWMNTNGKEGIEPPVWMKDLYDIDTLLRVVQPGTERAIQAEARFAKWVKENIPMFPVASKVVSPVVRPTNLGNLATKGRSSATQFASEQLFFK